MSTNRKFTWEELASLNQKHNAHVAVRGKVYDVSRFLSHHPGGSDLLLMAAGKDVTMVFESYHRLGSIAPETLKKYFVGDLVSSKFPTYPELGAFYKTVRERVQKHFEDTKQDPKNSPWIWFRELSVPAMMVFMWFAQVFWLSENLFLYCVAAGIMGLYSVLVTTFNLHDGSHTSVSRNPLVWRMFGHIQDFLNGSSYYVWMHKHVFSHHPYTNIDGFDPDVDIMTTNPETDIRRIKWRQAWFPRYYYQHIWVPMLYCTLGEMLRFEDIAILLRGQTSSTRLNVPSTSHLVVFICGKLFFVLYRFIVPFTLVGFWKMVAMNALAEMVGGYWFAILLESSHVISEVEWPKPDKDGRINRDWAELQVATTQDFGTDSWLLSYFTGGINHQVAHHLFPGVNPVFFPQITPIVRQTCEEFGVKYHFKDTLFEAMACHIAHLKRLGQMEEKPPNTTLGG